MNIFTNCLRTDGRTHIGIIVQTKGSCNTRTPLWIRSFFSLRIHQNIEFINTTRRSILYSSLLRISKNLLAYMYILATRKLIHLCCTAYARVFRFMKIKSWRSHVTVLHTCVSIMLKCISMQNLKKKNTMTGPRSAVGNVSGNRCESDCRYRGREFDPGPVPYFRGYWSWNYFYGHSPPFRWIIQEGRLLSVTSESMFTEYWLTACSSMP